MATEKSPLLSRTKPAIQGQESETTEENHESSFKFNFRRLLGFVGPGFLVSIAYLDPGNIEADLQSGTTTQYKLLWVLLWSTILGLLTQRIASRIGVVTGYQMSELCYMIYPCKPRILLWLMMEIAIIGSDIQEVIGTSIAFYILSSKKIPLYGGVLITLFDTLTFLLLENYGLKRLEMFFAFLIAIMAGTFGYEYVTAKPDQIDVIKGIFIPYCSGCNSYDAWVLGIGLVGSCIMPHNLYLHSSLVKSREINRRSKGQIKEANFYNLVETGFSLFISFLINLFVISVFGKGLYSTTNEEVYHMCAERNMTEGENQFPDNTHYVDNMNIYRGGLYLGCAYGSVAMYIWAVGILAAGQSSTMTGTYSGQVIMEGFLNLRWKKWKRVLFTRCMAIMPALFIALYGNIQELSGLNDTMNMLMAIQLPFALIPALTLTNANYIMGEFRNGCISKTILYILSISIIAANFYVPYVYVNDTLPHKWWIWFIVGIIAVFYTIFIIYLILYLLAMEGKDNRVTRLVLNEDTVGELWHEIHSGMQIEPAHDESDIENYTNEIST